MMNPAISHVAFLWLILHFSSRHFTGISRTVKYVERTAKISAMKKKNPIMLPPGIWPKISVIARKISDGPAVISMPEPTTEGMITKPAVKATVVSQIVTTIESFLMLAPSLNVAPSVTKIVQPIPTENMICTTASETVFHVRLLRLGIR